MEPLARRPFPPVEAGAFLVVVTAAAIGIGTLAGWGAGSLTAGLIAGLVLGLPAGVFAVYCRYRSSL
jgi:hypothetical protein